jgi:hypothetical protein
MSRFAKPTWRNTSLLIATAMLGAAVGVAPAAIVFTDGFGDGDRNNNGTSDLAPGATVDEASDVGIPWWKAKTNTGQNFTVVDDSAGIGSGLALEVEPTNTSSPTAIANFTPVTLNDGDKLVLRFNARLVTSPLPTGDRVFRWGLLNTAGVPKTSDGGASADTINHHYGFIGRADVGAAAADTLAVNQNNASALLGANQFLGGSDDPGAAFSDNTAKAVIFTIERNGDHLNVTTSVNGVIAGGSTADRPPENLGPIPFTFDEVAIGMNSANVAFRFDNVSLEYVAIPEPTVLPVLGAAALLLRRRSRTT